MFLKSECSLTWNRNVFIQGFVTATPACEASVLENDCKRIALRSASAVSCLNLGPEYKSEKDSPYTQGVSQIHDELDVGWPHRVHVRRYSL